MLVFWACSAEIVGIAKDGTACGHDALRANGSGCASDTELNELARNGLRAARDGAASSGAWAQQGLASLLQA